MFLVSGTCRCRSNRLGIVAQPVDFNMNLKLANAVIQGLTGPNLQEYLLFNKLCFFNNITVLLK